MALLATPSHSQGVIVSVKTELEYRILFEKLNKVLTERTDDALGHRIKLRDAVCAYVTVEQARGTAIDRVIHAVDAILRKAEEGAAVGAETMKLRDEALASRLVYWCIAFGTNGASGAAPA